MSMWLRSKKLEHELLVINGAFSFIDKELFDKQLSSSCSSQNAKSWTHGGSKSQQRVRKFLGFLNKGWRLLTSCTPSSVGSVHFRASYFWNHPGAASRQWKLIHTSRVSVTFKLQYYGNRLYPVTSKDDKVRYDIRRTSEHSGLIIAYRRLIGKSSCSRNLKHSGTIIVTTKAYPHCRVVRNQT